MNLPHRNNEPGRVCDGCRYWSEMIAQSSANGIQAYCLNPKSINYQEFTLRHKSCSEWRDGPWGAVDSPGGDPYADDFK